MPIKYACSNCGKGEGQGVRRENLMVKKIRFESMGSGARVFRSRVVGWLCPACLIKDEAWSQEDKRGHAPLKDKVDG